MHKHAFERHTDRQKDRRTNRKPTAIPCLCVRSRPVKITKLCCFNEDNPISQHSSVMQNSCKRIILSPLRRTSGPKLLRFEPAGLSHLGQPKPRRSMSRKSPCRPSGEKSCYKNAQVVANFTKCLTAYMTVTANDGYSEHLQ